MSSISCDGRGIIFIDYLLNEKQLYYSITQYYWIVSTTATKNEEKVPNGEEKICFTRTNLWLTNRWKWWKKLMHWSANCSIPLCILQVYNPSYNIFFQNKLLQRKTFAWNANVKVEIDVYFGFLEKPCYIKRIQMIQVRWNKNIARKGNYVENGNPFLSKKIINKNK